MAREQVAPDKIAAVEEITNKFRDSNAAVITAYTGLSVAQLKQLRRSLGENAQYRVVKNTLTKIAANDAGINQLDEFFQGSSAVAFVTGDPVAAAKGLRDFAKDNPALVIKGGIVDGAKYSADDLKKLAELESREVLLAKLAGGMKASMAKAAATFQAPLTKFVRTADALRSKVEQGGAGDPAPAAEDAPAE
jgi:large subunit ribosomal protein L10